MPINIKFVGVDTETKEFSAVWGVSKTPYSSQEVGPRVHQRLLQQATIAELMLRKAPHHPMFIAVVSALFYMQLYGG